MPASVWETPRAGRSEPLFRNAGYRAEPAPAALTERRGDDGTIARMRPGRRPAGAATAGRSGPLQLPSKPNYGEKAGHYIDMLSED